MGFLRERRKPYIALAGLVKDQRGITVLETVFILIVFAGVLSLFGLPYLKDRLQSAQKSPDVVSSAMSESSASLVLVGGVLGTANADGTALDSLVFRVTTGGRSIKAVDVSIDGATVSYLDEFRAYKLPGGQWSSTWRRGLGPFLDRGEIVEIQVTLRGLYPPLGTRTPFTIRVHPLQGEVLMVNRTIPAKLTAIMELK